jgi:hypothetical protein
MNRGESVPSLAYTFWMSIEKQASFRTLIRKTIWDFGDSGDLTIAQMLCETRNYDKKPDDDRFNF